MIDNPFFADEKLDYLLTSREILPALQERGVSQDAITQMLEVNPRTFFARA